jgi:preprotein translocase subunit SecA
VQRTAEGQNPEIRKTLWKYDCTVEHHRREIYGLPREVLLSPAWSLRSMLPEEQYCELIEAVGDDALETAGRKLTLAIVDDLWADYLANVVELKRAGYIPVSCDGRDPLYEFLTGEREIYAGLHRCLKEDLAGAFATAEIRDAEIHFRKGDVLERGATWTYIPPRPAFRNARRKDHERAMAKTLEDIRRME